MYETVKHISKCTYIRTYVLIVSWFQVSSDGLIINKSCVWNENFIMYGTGKTFILFLIIINTVQYHTLLCRGYAIDVPTSIYDSEDPWFDSIYIVFIMSSTKDNKSSYTHVLFQTSHVSEEENNSKSYVTVKRVEIMISPFEM